MTRAEPTSKLGAKASVVGAFISVYSILLFMGAFLMVGSNIWLNAIYSYASDEHLDLKKPLKDFDLSDIPLYYLPGCISPFQFQKDGYTVNLDTLRDFVITSYGIFVPFLMMTIARTIGAVLLMKATEADRTHEDAHHLIAVHQTIQTMLACIEGTVAAGLVLWTTFMSETQSKCILVFAGIAVTMFMISMYFVKLVQPFLEENLEKTIHSSTGKNAFDSVMIIKNGKKIICLRKKPIPKKGKGEQAIYGVV